MQSVSSLLTGLDAWLLLVPTPKLPALAEQLCNPHPYPAHRSKTAATTLPCSQKVVASCLRLAKRWVGSQGIDDRRVASQIMFALWDEFTIQRKLVHASEVVGLLDRLVIVVGGKGKSQCRCFEVNER